MANEFDIHKLVSNPMLASISGALLGLRWTPGASWRDKALNVASGAAVAGYVGPVVCSALSLTAAHAQAAIGFALGLFGLSLAGSVMDSIRDGTVRRIVESWLTRR
jgi:hypothetical protein